MFNLPPPTISVIVPAYNSAATIARCVTPLIEMRRRGEIAELLIVDDGSTDATATIAAEMGAVVLPSGGRLGPGGARNVAARVAVGEVLWFMDSDTVAHEDAARILATNIADPTVAAVFGAYDDRPPATGFWSLYKNLVHHHYHHQSEREAETFWSGCGAIRAAAFAELGGFDAATYPEPSTEDIELGWRMRQRGMRILLVPELKVTHLKVWRFVNLIYTEIFCRALPWSRLIHRHTGWLNTLNVSRAERGRALLAIIFLASFALLQISLWVPLVLFVAALAANHRLGALFHRRGGARFALGAILFHQVYYCYCSGAVAWSWQEHSRSSLRLAMARRFRSLRLTSARQPLDAFDDA